MDSVGKREIKKPGADVDRMSALDNLSKARNGERRFN